MNLAGLLSKFLLNPKLDANNWQLKSRKQQNSYLERSGTPSRTRTCAPGLGNRQIQARIASVRFKTGSSKTSWVRPNSHRLLSALLSKSWNQHPSSSKQRNSNFYILYIMQFLQTAMSLIVNFCLPFRRSPVPVRKNPFLEPQLQRDEPGEGLMDLLPVLIRMDVEGAMFNANYRMYKHERLKEYFENLAKDLRRRGYPKTD